MLKKFLIIISVILLALFAKAFALVIGGSNLGIMGYPSPSCYLYSRDEYSVRSYIDCINEYVENANNDIKRIKEAAQDAVSDAKFRLSTY